MEALKSDLAARQADQSEAPVHARILKIANSPSETSRRPKDRPVGWYRPAWMTSTRLAGAWLCLLLYGSLMPFDFAVGEFVSDAQSPAAVVFALLTGVFQSAQLPIGLSSLGLSAWTGDLALNLLLYVPLGVLLRIAVCRADRSWMRQVMLSGCGVIAVSYCVETLQLVMPSRVASALDLLANSATGVVAAMFGLTLWKAFRWSVFFVYCRTSPLMFAVLDVVRELRHKPAAVGIVVVMSLSAAGTVYMNIDLGGMANPGGSFDARPFDRLFALPYDEAAYVGGQLFGLYCLVAFALAVVMFRPQLRRGMGRTIGLTVAFSAGVQLLRLAVTSEPMGITELLIALPAGVFVIAALTMVVFAARCCCRRRVSQPVEHDRRRRHHNYGPAVLAKDQQARRRTSA